MPELIDSADKAHSEAEELLPWYATGELDAHDRSIVEDHLASCSRCQRQLAAERRLIQEFRATDPRINNGWARVRARIEQPVVIRPKFGGAAEMWNIARRPAVAMLAAAQLAFLILGGAVLISLSRPAYHALGSSSAPTAANIIVIFEPSATEAQMREALRGSGASLVGGPTPTNAYLLQVQAADRAKALARLQSNREVEMAQPIDQAAS